MAKNEWWVERFIDSRGAANLSPRTLEFYRDRLGPFIKFVRKPVAEVQSDDIDRFLMSLHWCGPGGRHAYYRGIRVFYGWMKARRFMQENPAEGVEVPHVPRRLLPTVTPADLEVFLAATESLRDRSLLALMLDSGGRRSELAQPTAKDIDWERQRIRIVGKGGKDGYLLFGPRTASFLKKYIEQEKPAGNIFGLTGPGIRSLIQRLSNITGIKASPHAFRRGFATQLRRMGVGELDIQQLGRWESLEMVRRYTRSHTFDDAAERYKPIVI